MASLYPGALDTNDSLYVVVNNAFGLLTAGVDSNAVTLFLNVPIGAPATGAVTIKGEAIKYTGKTTSSLTGCVRGYDGTAKASHFINDEVDFGPIADHHNAVVQAIQAMEAKLGTGANFPSATITASIANASILPVKISNTNKARAASTAGQALLAGTFTKVQFPNKTTAGNYDLGGNFDAAVNYRYTAVVPGIYTAKTVITFVPATQPTRRIVTIYKNGTEYSRSDTINGSGNPGSSYEQVLHTDDVNMVATDYLEIWVWAQFADNTGFLANPGDYSFFAVSLQP
jgi:hypothetical protein